MECQTGASILPYGIGCGWMVVTQKSARLGCVKMVQLTVSEQLTHNGGLKCDVEFLKPLIAVGVYIFKEAHSIVLQLQGPFKLWGYGISIGDGVPVQPHWEILPHVVARLLGRFGLATQRLLIRQGS